MPKIYLTGTNVLLQPLPKKLKSAGGVLMSERYQDDETQYRVLAVGPGKWIRRKGKKPYFKACEVEVGDHVLTEQVHGNKLQMPNGVIIIEHDEIIAKWRPGEAQRQSYDETVSAMQKHYQQHIAPQESSQSPPKGKTLMEVFGLLKP